MRASDLSTRLLLYVGCGKLGESVVRGPRASSRKLPEGTVLMKQSTADVRKGARKGAAFGAAGTLLATLVLASCAHTPSPSEPSLKVPSEDPVGVTVPVATAHPDATAPDFTATNPEPTAPPAAQAAAEVDTTSEPTPVAGITPAQYGDLFDRMRAGFKIDDVEHRSVDAQANW